MTKKKKEIESEVSDKLIGLAIYIFLSGVFFAIGTLMVKMGYDIWFSLQTPLEILVTLDRTFTAGILLMASSAILMIMGALLKYYGE